MTANYQIIIGFLIIAISAIGTVFGGLMVKKGFAERSKSYSEVQTIQQKSTGINSPNINAPNAKTIQINYGISEKISKEWIEQQKGNKEVTNKLIYNFEPSSGWFVQDRQVVQLQQDMSFLLRRAIQHEDDDRIVLAQIVESRPAEQISRFHCQFVPS